MLATRHILYLEDDPDDGALLTMLLGQASSIDFEVTVCDSVDSAMLALSMQAYDAVFCDYLLQDERGADTAERFVEQVLEHFPLLPLVVTSGLSKASLNRRLQARIAAGSIGFLHKSAWQTGTLIGVMASVQQKIEQTRTLPDAHILAGQHSGESLRLS